MYNEFDREMASLKTIRLPELCLFLKVAAIEKRLQLGNLDSLLKNKWLKKIYIYHVWPICDLFSSFWSRIWIHVMFIYSQKATNFCEISTLDLSYVLHNGQIYAGDFAKFCDLLKIYELYHDIFTNHSLNFQSWISWFIRKFLVKSG